MPPRRDQLGPAVARRERERGGGHPLTYPRRRARETHSRHAAGTRAPVGGPVVVSLPRDSIGVPQRPHGRPARRYTERAGRAPATAARIAARAHATRRQLLVARRPDRKPRRQPHGPERLRHPHVPDPGDEPLILEHLAERPRPVGAAEARDERRRIGRLGEQVRAEPAHRAEVECQHRPVPLRRLDPPARRTSHGRPAPVEPTGPTRQRPFIRRWLRTVTPPSKRSSRCFPTASTPSSRRPSTAAATPVTSPRGCGEVAVTRSPTSGRSRAAARWRESPSGTGEGCDVPSLRFVQESSR